MDLWMGKKNSCDVKWTGPETTGESAEYHQMTYNLLVNTVVCEILDSLLISAYFDRKMGSMTSCVGAES